MDCQNVRLSWNAKTGSFVEGYCPTHDEPIRGWLEARKHMSDFFWEITLKNRKRSMRQECQPTK